MFDRRRNATMKRLTWIILAVVFLLTASVSHGEWKMRVHQGSGVDEYSLTAVDSVTFYDEPASSLSTVLVPAGTFIQGDLYGMCNMTERQVTLTRDFHFGRSEVTNQEYRDLVQWAFDNGHVTANAARVLDALDGSTEELLDLDDSDCRIAYAAGVFTVDAGWEDHPVNELTWYGAVSYCDWMSMQNSLPRAYDHTTWECNDGDPYGATGYRLPTDAEWEYAAQYDDERIWPYEGSGIPNCEKVNFEHCIGSTTPVGTYTGWYSELGCWDLSGNVAEWCNDYHVCELDTVPITDPVGAPSSVYRVLHGGSWQDGPSTVRCSERRWNIETHASAFVGFRIARTAE